MTVKIQELCVFSVTCDRIDQCEAERSNFWAAASFRGVIAVVDDVDVVAVFCNDEYLSRISENIIFKLVSTPVVHSWVKSVNIVQNVLSSVTNVKSFNGVFNETYL